MEVSSFPNILTFLCCLGASPDYIKKRKNKNMGKKGSDYNRKFGFNFWHSIWFPGHYQE